MKQNLSCLKWFVLKTKLFLLTEHLMHQNGKLLVEILLLLTIVLKCICCFMYNLKFMNHEL